MTCLIHFKFDVSKEFETIDDGRERSSTFICCLSLHSQFVWFTWLIIHCFRDLQQVSQTACNMRGLLTSFLAQLWMTTPSVADSDGQTCRHSLTVRAVAIHSSSRMNEDCNSDIELRFLFQALQLVEWTIDASRTSFKKTKKCNIYLELSHREQLRHHDYEGK